MIVCEASSLAAVLTRKVSAKEIRVQSIVDVRLGRYGRSTVWRNASIQRVPERGELVARDGLLVPEVHRGSVV